MIRLLLPVHLAFLALRAASVRGMIAPDKGLRWTLCSLLFLATTLSVLAPQLQTELQLDNLQLGYLLPAFYWSYTLGQFAAGLAMDRYWLRWLYGDGVVAWSLVSALTGLSTGFGMLFGFRVLLAGGAANGFASDATGGKSAGKRAIHQWNVGGRVGGGGRARRGADDVVARDSSAPLVLIGRRVTESATRQRWPRD